jgi:hypothetical protein
MRKKSKTDVIREHLLSSKSFEQSPNAVVQDLKKKGVDVTVHHVGMVKLSIRGKRVLKRIGNRSGRSGRTKKNSGLFIAKDLLKFCNNNLDLALQNLKVVAKLMND